MAVKVAINGFGRIGRLAFRQMFGAEGFEIVAINDLTSPKMLAHLLKYDSTQGKYALADTVTAGEDSITVDGKEIKIYAKANAAELPWGEIGVDVVLECTGFYTSKDKAQAHIDAGAKHVIISAPAGNDLKTIVYNVNHETLTKEDHIISAASCTTNCLAPMAKALNDLADDLTILEQNKVDDAIELLTEAINGLTLKGADYSKLDVVKKEAEKVLISDNYTKGHYTEESKALFDEAYEVLSSLADNLTIIDQGMVDEVVKALDTAIKGLTLKTEEPGQIVKPNEPGQSTKPSDSSSAKTGDDQMIYGYGIVTLLALGGLMMLKRHHTS